jgi:hypothetical protein
MTKNTLKLLGWFYKRKFERLKRAQKVDYLSIEHRLAFHGPPSEQKI